MDAYAGVGESAALEVAKLFFENVIYLFEVLAIVLHDHDPQFMVFFWFLPWILLGSHTVFSSAFHLQN